MTLQSDAVNGLLGERHTACSASLDHDFCKVTLQEDARLARRHGRGIERHLDDFRLAVGVCREVHNLRPGLACRNVVFAVAGDGRHVEALDVVRSLLAGTIYHVINGTLVVTLIDAEPQHVLADKELVGHAHYLELSVLVEDDDVVNVGAVADILVLLQTGSDEAFVAVDVEFLVCFHHLGGLDGVEVAYFRHSRVFLAVFVF